MPFDGGFNSGSSQVTALQGFNAQLVSTFGWNSAQAYAHEGFSAGRDPQEFAEASVADVCRRVIGRHRQGPPGPASGRPRG